MIIRKANVEDVCEISKIYDSIHDEEEAGRIAIGWERGVYPTSDTAKASIEAGTMFVMEDNGNIVAAAKIDRNQVDAYADGSWEYEADDSQVMVLHTLVVDPARSGRGYGKEFVRFYEEYALEQGCPYMRMDTNERNLRARAMYKTLGYKEADTVPCVFNGISGVQLVLLEKHLEDRI